MSVRIERSCPLWMPGIYRWWWSSVIILAICLFGESPLFSLYLSLSLLRPHTHQFFGREAEKYTFQFCHFFALRDKSRRRRRGMPFIRWCKLRPARPTRARAHNLSLIRSINTANSNCFEMNQIQWWNCARLLILRMKESAQSIAGIVGALFNFERTFSIRILMERHFYWPYKS